MPKLLIYFNTFFLGLGMEEEFYMSVGKELEKDDVEMGD